MAQVVLGILPSGLLLARDARFRQLRASHVSLQTVAKTWQEEALHGLASCAPRRVPGVHAVPIQPPVFGVVADEAARFEGRRADLPDVGLHGVDRWEHRSCQLVRDVQAAKVRTLLEFEFWRSVGLGQLPPS